jgi:pyrroline-5-carboxylate reductase
MTQISFIGGGNMASALIEGLLNNTATKEDIHVVDIYPPTRLHLTQQFGIHTDETLNDRLRTSDVIILAIKPQQMKTLATELAPYLGHQLIISIAAGIRLHDLSRWLNNYPNLIRTMPNTPALIKEGVTGLIAMPQVSAQNCQLAERILQSVGHTIWVNQESDIDHITAISGSGPAYVFYLIEALQEAAEQLGFSAADAKFLALQTFKGASQLALHSPESPHTLRERVTSKGGTTHAAITHMETHQLKDLFIDAVKAAAHRAQTLGEELGES